LEAADDTAGVIIAIDTAAIAALTVANRIMCSPPVQQKC
jgi:hypothetical protein